MYLFSPQQHMPSVPNTGPFCKQKILCQFQVRIYQQLWKNRLSDTKFIIQYSYDRDNYRHHVHCTASYLFNQCSPIHVTSKVSRHFQLQPGRSVNNKIQSINLHLDAQQIIDFWFIQ